MLFPGEEQLQEVYWRNIATLAVDISSCTYTYFSVKYRKMSARLTHIVRELLPLPVIISLISSIYSVKGWTEHKGNGMRCSW